MITEFLHRYTEFQLFAWTVGILGPFAALAVATRYYWKTRVGDDELETQARDFLKAERDARESGLLIGDQPESPTLRAARERFRSEGSAVDVYTTLSRDVNDVAIRHAATEHARANGYRAAGGAPYTTLGPAPKIVSFTPRQLDRINRCRRAAGRPTLNNRGFRAATAAAATDPRTQPNNSNDWLTYFLLFEILTDSGHTGPCNGGITINPNEPYNGQGGEFAGAGASGDWTAPDASTASAAAAIDTRTAFESDKYSPGDTVGGYTTPERAVEPATADDGYHYSAPAQDPTPSQSDPSPSYSSSSDSGSSSGGGDSGSSSSSGGGDSGGGGGGGGGDGS